MPNKKQISPHLKRLVELTKNPALKTGEALLKQVEQEATIIPGLQTSLDYWIIPGVEYRNGIYTVNLAKTLLDNGSAKTQDQWAEYSRQAKQKGDFYTGDFPLYHAAFTRLFKNKDSQTAQEAKEFIKKVMREKYLMTLTRIRYKPKGKDEVVHNYKMDDEYTIQEEIVGPDRKISSGDISALTAILGVSDINEIAQVYEWTNQTPTYIWRLNSKPENIDERVARLRADSDGVYLICYRWPEYSDASLGVFGCAEGTRARGK